MLYGLSGWFPLTSSVMRTDCVDNVNTGALLLRIQDAAAALGVSKALVYELVATGELRSVRVRRCLRIPFTELLKVASEGLREGFDER